MANSLTDRNEIILFSTKWGKYPVTRRERYRLARLHGLTEAEARHVAYNGAERAPTGIRADAGRSYSADHLARLFDAEGNDRRAARPAPGLIPSLPRALPRALGAGRAGS